MSSPQTFHDRRDLKRVTLLLLILVSACFFTFYRSNVAYNSDEVWSIRAASLTQGELLNTLKADVHPPLYFEFLYGWIRIFGIGERAARGLSAFFYILSAFAVYVLSRRLIDSRTAILATTLYVCSPLAILSSKFARMYSLLSFLSILSSYFYLQFITKSRLSRIGFTAYILTNVLGTLTHIGFFFVLFAQIIFVLFFRRQRVKLFCIGLTLSLLPYLILWAPVLIRQFVHSNEGLAWINKPTISSLGAVLLMYGGALWVMIPLLFYLWWRAGRKPLKETTALNKTTDALWLMLISVGTPILISFIKPIFNSRIAIIGLHLFVLTAAAAIGKTASYFLSIELIILTTIGIILLHPGAGTCDNRATAAYLNQAGIAGDVVIFTSLTRSPIDFYLERLPRGSDLVKTSFPSEIDRHPGYEGRITDPSRRPALENEARELVNKLTELPTSKVGRRIFLLRGFHPEIDSIIETELSKRFTRSPGEGRSCGDESPYFTEIVVYK